MTQAEKIAERFGGDGTRWVSKDGISLLAYLQPLADCIESQDDLTRFVLLDGSAIVVGASGWDIEGTAPFSWEGN